MRTYPLQSLQFVFKVKGIGFHVFRTDMVIMLRNMI